MNECNHVYVRWIKRRVIWWRSLFCQKCGYRKCGRSGNHANYRGLAIHQRQWHLNSGRPRSHTTWHMRKIQTTQEHRVNCDPMHTPYVRGRRRSKSLPNSRDDLTSRNSAGWKRSTKRKHQWKAKGL